jgi:hypothetical protein
MKKIIIKNKVIDKKASRLNNTNATKKDSTNKNSK